MSSSARYDRDGLSNGAAEEPFAGIADDVAGQRERIVGIGEGADVLDDSPQLPIDVARTDAPHRPDLVLAAEDELILVLRLQVLVERRERGQPRRCGAPSTARCSPAGCRSG